MNKILIAEPIYHAMRPDVYFNRIAFWRSVYAKQFSYSEKSITSRVQHYEVRSMVIGPRNAIRVARDKAIRAAIQHNATHLLFMDDDILVPPDILSKLLAVDRPIVGGLIHRDNGDPLVWKLSDGGEAVWYDHPKKEAFQCAAVAAGCMLITVATIKHLVEYGKRRWLFNYDDSERSMDVRFCRFAREMGFPSWCWPDEKCVQVSEYPTT